MLPFYTVDVFAAARFGGNPLAVVLNADALSAKQMQSIAGEFNLSETTFVRRPKDPANSAEVRIFTPLAEMPFAGHPNVGTAYVLAKVGHDYGIALRGGGFVFEEIAGLVSTEIMMEDGQPVGARLTAPQPFRRMDDVPVELVAAACGLDESAIDVSHHPPVQASCGAPFVFVEVRDRATLSTAQPHAAVFHERLARATATGIHLYVRDPTTPTQIHSRMFAPLHGVAEDPATGSANVALVGLLAHLDPRQDLQLALDIEQGRDMGRPSQLAATAEKRGDVVTTTRIGGRCVDVMHGEITLT